MRGGFAEPRQGSFRVLVNHLAEMQRCAEIKLANCLSGLGASANVCHRRVDGLFWNLLAKPHTVIDAQRVV